MQDERAQHGPFGGRESLRLTVPDDALRDEVDLDAGVEQCAFFFIFHPTRQHDDRRVGKAAQPAQQVGTVAVG